VTLPRRRGRTGFVYDGAREHVKQLLDRFWLEDLKSILFASDAGMLQVGGAVKRDGEVLGKVKAYRMPRDEADEYFASFKKFKKIVEYLAKAGLRAKGVYAVVAQSPNAEQRPLLLLMRGKSGGRGTPRSDRTLGRRRSVSSVPTLWTPSAFI
jgi:hypothetical protein